MTGLEFKYIRKFNKISQIEVANQLGYLSNYSISQIEEEEFVSDKHLHILSELSGISMKNLLDDAWVEEYCKKIPIKYKKPKRIKGPTIFPKA